MSDDDATTVDQEGQNPENQIEGYEPPEVGGWEGYPLDELAIRDERRSATDVNRRIEQGRFILDPDFQRDFVWKTDKQSRLIESILLRIPLPVFYVAEDTDGRLIVVDGRQRLTTLQRFFDGKLRLKLPDRPELNHKTFKRLEPRLQNRIEDCQLHFYIIDHAVPERARLDIFERVNGGEVLTRQQMRNAIFSGPATALLRNLAESEIFKTATGNSLNVLKMQDREFINRFFSFALFPISDYKGDMDEWLAKSLVALNATTAEERERLSERFHVSMQNNLLVFKENSFRKHAASSNKRGIINASLFDIMSTGLAAYDTVVVSSRKDRLRQGFFQLMDNPDFIKSITYSTSTPNVVRHRFEHATQLFADVFSD